MDLHVVAEGSEPTVVRIIAVPWRVRTGRDFPVYLALGKEGLRVIGQAQVCLV